MNETVRHRQIPCPYCDHDLDRTSDAVGNAHPVLPGDPTLCVACGGLLFVGDDLAPRAPRPGEFKALPPETVAEIARVRAVLSAARGDER